MELLGHTKSGIPVCVDPVGSHAATHFDDDPKLLELVKEALPQCHATEDHIRTHIDMGRVVGDSIRVETTDADEILYAQRRNREGMWTRFVKNRAPEPTRCVTIDLKKVDDYYNLHTAYVGSTAPSFPGQGDFLPEQSHDFWSKHALIWGTEEIIEGTETTECPW